MTLSLKSETYLNVYYTKQITATATNLDKAQLAIKKSGSEWIARVTGITAKNLGRIYTFTVKYDSVTSTQKYCALSWAYNVLSKNMTENIPLAKALYLYQQAAVAYFGNK